MHVYMYTNGRIKIYINVDFIRFTEVSFDVNCLVFEYLESELHPPLPTSIRQ